ncbi:MAG: two-component system, LuxR family, sensor kinase FixL [Acidobacteriota bacterium]|nr:two-component system, LuxR family, sensor kinase FixL [Acidobacteriota bacterium]
MTPADIVQALTDILLRNIGMVYLLSAVVSIVIALVIFSLLHRFKILQDNKWIKPFAQAFLVLAVMYSIRFLAWLFFGLNKGQISSYVVYAIRVNTAICSSLSSYFFFAVGFSLVRKSRRLRFKILNFLHIKNFVARYIVLVLLFIVALISTTGIWWTRIPDILFSAPALVFVGLALYRNISFRRDPFMAWLALLAAIIYAGLHISYGLHPWITSEGWADWIVGVQGDIWDKVDKMDLIIFSLALPLKFGLFFPGYALMLMIANPTGEVRRLLKTVTHESAEFLENEGVVRSIKEEIQADRIELYIKLPGTEKHNVASYRYPVEKGAVESEEIPFDEHTDYGYVLSTGEELLFRLINYSDQVPTFLRGTLSPQSSVIAVPVLFHNAIIGCLKAELDDGYFAEADMQNIQRYASLLSPIVQSYREVDALNEISHRLTQLQFEATGYHIQKDIERIAQITHDILAPLATGVSIEAGFYHYKASIPIDATYYSMMKRQLDSPESEIFSISDSENLRWLLKPLQITSAELKRDGAADGKHFFGKLILATYAKWDKTNTSTLATNFFHRRVVSNLIIEALLNFIRGYLGEVNRKLAASLSGLSEAGVSHWFKTIEDKAREAHLLWAVASQPYDHTLLGTEVELVRQLEEKGRWEKKDTHDEDTSSRDIWLCTLDSPHGLTSHVIKISLPETNHIIWLGVGNPAFKFELDYLSPWATFVLRFGEIADIALQRILSRQEREKFEKEAADFHGLATAAITTGTVIHQMVNQVRDLTGPLTTLEEAIRFRTLIGSENHRRLILSLGKSALQIEELTKLFAGVTKPDERRPCSLYEAAEYAFNFLRDSLTRYNINFDLQVPSTYIVDVPFYVASFALANLLNNAKDAIRDGKVKDGVIQVRAEEAETEKMILCHVTDNGSGVPPRMIGQLFESSGKRNKPYGSGLGLYLSARSLRESRGDIKLTRPGPDPQTTFTIYFPKRRKD